MPNDTANTKDRLTLIRRIVILQLGLMAISTILILVATMQDDAQPVVDPGVPITSSTGEELVPIDGSDSSSGGLENLAANLVDETASSEPGAKTKTEIEAERRLSATSIGFFWFGFLGGMFGASIALLRKVTGGEEIDAYLHSKSWTITLCPFLYGGIMAGVVFFLMISGMISGEDGGGMLTTNLFPTFEGGVPSDGELLSMKHFRTLRPKTIQDGAKAIIWCVLAGFSESFVTGMLSSLEFNRDNNDTVE